MSSRRSVRHLVVAVLLGVLVGGGLMAVTPAGAQVSSAAATSWKKVWKKNLKPLATKSFYTKKQTKARFQTKGAYEAAGAAAAAQAAATAAANSATDSKLGNYYKQAETYTKAEVDAKLAPLVNSVAATAGGDQSLDLTNLAQVARSVSIMPPADGNVIVSSSAYVVNDGAVTMTSRCSVTTGNAIDFDFLQFAKINDPGDSGILSGTRGFAVTKGALLTVNLVCDRVVGTAAVRDSALTAIFAPS